MRYRIVPWLPSPSSPSPAAVVAAASTAGHRSSTLSAGDNSACQSLEDDTAGGNDPVALNTDFGLNGRRTGALSAQLSPYVQLVGGDAQLVLSGADDGKLGEYVGQMRGVCESLGWRAH
jgi:hypothetical protein